MVERETPESASSNYAVCRGTRCTEHLQTERMQCKPPGAEQPYWKQSRPQSTAPELKRTWQPAAGSDLDCCTQADLETDCQNCARTQENLETSAGRNQQGEQQCCKPKSLPCHTSRLHVTHHTPHANTLTCTSQQGNHTGRLANGTRIYTHTIRPTHSADRWP